MTKILLTGGAGFIGSHTLKALLRKGHEPVVIDDFNDFYDPARKEKNIEPFLKDIVLERMDIRDGEGVERVVEREQPDVIIHLAARAGVRPSIAEPKLYEEVNVGGTLNLLEAAKKHAVRRFIFGSSSSVYGNSMEIPFKEDAKVDRPVSPYAATKKAGELLCHTYHHLYGIKMTCLRFFTVYGPAGRPDMAPWLFTEAIASGRPLRRFGDGNARRDYTYVDDIVSGIVAAVETPLDYEIINLGNHQTVPLSELIATIEALLNKSALIEPYPEQPGDVPLTYADIQKAQKLLGYAPKTDIKAGMGHFIDWYLRNFAG